MNQIAKFEKVSYEQFKKDFIDAFPDSDFSVTTEEGQVVENIRYIYDHIKLPKRATTGSAGYDFFAPVWIDVKVDECKKIPTGIRCYIEDGWVLQLYPRSGHGFKYGVSLANTVGIIDADYYSAKNEGHIHVKLLNDSSIGSDIHIGPNEAFCQGVFVPFGVTYDDDTDGVRVGGFGSTSNT